MSFTLVTDDRPGTVVTIVAAPVMPGDLAEIAERLPERAILVASHLDGRTVTLEWEISTVVPVD